MARFLKSTYSIMPNYAVHIPDRWLFLAARGEAQAISDDRQVYHFAGAYARYMEVDREQSGGLVSAQPFTTLASLWKWVDSLAVPGKAVHMVLSDVPFCFQVLAGFRELPALGWRLAHIYTKDKVTIMRWRKGGAGLVVLDIRNWYSAWEEDKRSVLKECHALEHAVGELVTQLRDGDLGSMRYTAASIAWSVWRHKFYGDPIITHHKEAAVWLERLAYVGGYCRVLRLYAPPTERMYKLDVNSMYPFAMLRQLFPVRLHSVVASMEPAELLEAMDKYCAIARVEIETDEPIYPYRGERAVHYPVGAFETVLCTGSLQRLLETDQVRRVHGVVLYKRGDPFSRFVEHWYERKVAARRECREDVVRFCKLMLNSLYGKFGQKATDERMVGTAPGGIFKCMLNWVPETGDEWTELVAGGSVFEFREGGETLTSFPAIAAHVTDYARLHLWEIIRAAGRHTCWYCDTDSVIVNGAGLDRLAGLRSPHLIGALKTEETADGVRVYAKKDYQLGGTRVIKGAKAPELIRPDGTFNESWRLSLFSAAEIEQVEGAHELYVQRLYNPWVSDCRIDKHLRCWPLELPQDKHLLGRRVYTRPIHERI